MKWAQSVRFCDEGIHNACKTYHRLCLECDGGGSRQRGASGAFLVYMDKVSVKSIVDHLIEGEMMWEKAFYEFAATATGGKMTDEGARARWLEMVEEAHRGERLLDHDGCCGDPHCYEQAQGRRSMFSAQTVRLWIPFS